MSERVFGKWRARLWPIHREELNKVIPLLFMKFFVSLNYSLLTSMKDAMVVTARGGGAEVIPVLKGWGVLPVAVLATFIYAQLATRVRPATLFRLVLFTFMGLIALYTYVLYPNMDALSPHASADAFQAWLGGRGMHWVSVYRNWVPSFFFIMAELWGSFAIFMLFWGFSNQIHTVSEAKRTYTLYIAAGDLAAMLGGRMLVHVSKQGDFLASLQGMTIVMMLSGVAIFFLHQWLIHKALPQNWEADAMSLHQNGGKSKSQLSFTASLKHVFSSKYILCLAIMVISVGLTINMIEVSWKASLKLLYPEPSDYQAYMGTVTSLVGSIAFLTVILVGSGLIRYLGWFVSACLTPAVVGVTGIIFLGLVVIYRTDGAASIGFHVPLLLLVTVGAIQNIAAKVMKYSFFDPTKEMAFIPLDAEEKTQGKAAVDVVSSRLGKSGSSWLQVALLDILGHSSILSVSHFLLVIVALAVVAWVYALRVLRKAIPEEAL